MHGTRSRKFLQARPRRFCYDGGLLCGLHGKTGASARPGAQKIQFEVMVKEDACLLLEYEPMQQWFREVFGEGYKIRGVYEPEANDVDGAQKGAPMSHEETNEHRANPVFRAGVNDSYSLNCRTCVVAYELRRRGMM